MAVRLNILHDDNPGGLARHLLWGTEQRAERDAQVALQLDPEPGAHRGSVPRVQADMAPEVQAALGLTPRLTPSREMLEHLLAGRRADGEPLGRSRYAANGGKRVAFVLVTVSPHISVSLARALAKTESARAVIDSAHRGANAAVMAQAEREILGWTRRGAQGRIEEQGRVGRIEIDHQTTRRTQDGHVAPMRHTENLVFNAVVTSDGHVGAFDLRRMQGRVAALDVVYQEELVRRLTAAGANVRMENGAAVMADIPAELHQAMSRRTAQATEWALDYAKGRGMLPEDAATLDSFAPRLRADLIKRGAKATQRTSHDAMGDRAAWVREARQHGFEPRDLVSPSGAMSPTEQVGAVLERSAALRRAAVERMQATMHMREAAAVAGREAPSLARVALHQRVLDAVQQEAREMQAAVRTLAPPPSRQAQDRVAALRAAIRQQTAKTLKAVAHGIAWRVGAEVNDWVRAYHLGPVVRAAATVVRWGAAQIRQGIEAHRQARQAAREAAMELPAAKRAAAVVKVPDTPPAVLEIAIAQRRRAIRQAAESSARQAKGLGASPRAGRMFSDARAATLVRQMAQAQREMAGPLAPDALVVYGPPVPPRLGAARLREEVQDVLANPPADPAPQPQQPPRTVDALLRAHGTPENVLNARARALGIGVAKGEMALSDATANLYRTWRMMNDAGKVPGDDPDKVFAATERRITLAAEDFYVRRLQKQGAALRGATAQEQGAALSQ